MPSLDLTKPVQTRDGRKVEILSTKGRGDYPIKGYIGKELGLNGWTLGGLFFHDRDGSDRDLVNVPEEKWVNVYARNGNDNDLYLGTVFPSEKAALASARLSGSVCIATIPLHLYMKD